MRQIIKLFFLCFFSFTAWAKGITVELDAAQIEVGQQVRLTLTYDPKEAQGIPDLRALQNDFTILATEQSTSYTVINGQARSIGQWGLVLEPKHTGMITIPALRIGPLTSEPIQLNVNPSTHAAAKQSTDQNMPVLDPEDATALTVSVDNKKPYLNQEVLYKVRLTSKHRLIDARYQAPQVEDAILFPLGDGQQYQTTRGGVVYQVDEQSYAIFPQKSGPLKITPPSLHALTYDFSPKPVTLTGDAVTLQIQPLPKHIVRRQWLPSKLVRLQESYEQTETKLSQGATIVRHIDLQAQGLVAQLLPEISFPDSADLRIYPGQTERDNRIQQGELWGHYKLKITYVFPRSGTVIIPAIKLPWFNVKTQKLELAELPAKTYEIMAMGTAKKTKPLLAPPKKNNFLKKHVSSSHPPAWELKPIMLVWIALVIGILSLLVSAGVWVWQISQPRRGLRAACHANDIERTKLALVAWGRQHWPNSNILHFTDIIPLLPEHSPLYKALQEFSRIVYRPDPMSHWQGAALWQAVKAFKKPHATQYTSDSIIPPIHPTRK
ncbi:MAG: BatD family protein [Gammaproteobacteria bacterium]